MDENLHRGHRARMRSKLARHGAEIFDTYELLEMLLYAALPHKDTNPTAKRLLAKFGTLAGVLSASTEELATVEGVGAKTAELISTVGKYGDILQTEKAVAIRPFLDFHAAGKYIVDYFEQKPEEVAVAMLLDNGMHLIDTVSVPCKHFGSAAVKPRFFLDLAARMGACNVILACHHEFGALFMAESEFQTYRLIRDALGDISVPVVAMYVVCGRKYTRVGGGMTVSLAAPSVETAGFVDSVCEGVFEVE